MRQQFTDTISQPVLSQPLIGPGRPVGGGGGCMPGTTLLDLPLTVTPNSLFVAPGTVVQLAGSARVRRFLPDCTTHDVKAPIEWDLSYQSVDSGVAIPVTSFLADGRVSPHNHFTAGNPGTYEVVLTCPLAGAATSARVNAGRGAVLEGTAIAWVSNSFLGCRKFDKGPDGNPISFQALIVTSPLGVQSTVDFEAIRLPKAVITETSPGTGSFDPSAGTIEVQIHAAVQALFSGTVDMTLSTSATITPCDGSSVSGSAVSGGRAVLVGDAPVDGPPGTTHAWLAVTANVTPVGF